MTTIRTNHESSGGGVVDKNLPCWGCGYNLRSIAYDKACPECGASVSRSLQGDRLVFSDRKWLRRLVIGTNWLLASSTISLFLAVLWITRSLFRIDIDTFIESLQIAYQIKWIIMLVGVFLVTSSEYGRGSKQSILRVWARWLLLAASIFGTILFVAHFASSFVSPAITLPLSSLRQIIHTLGGIALILYLGALAGRAEWPGLVLQTRLLSVGYVISLFVGLLINLTHMLLVFDIIDHHSLVFQLVGYASFAYTYFLYSGMIIWELIFLLILRRSLVALHKLTTSNVEH